MNERIEELMSTICEGQNSIQREEVENYINNLQSKIDKAIEYIKTEASYSIFRNMCEGMLNYEKVNELLDILKEEK